jgi:hypothetical protein
VRFDRGAVVGTIGARDDRAAAPVVDGGRGDAERGGESGGAPALGVAPRVEGLRGW